MDPLFFTIFIVFYVYGLLWLPLGQALGHDPLKPLKLVLPKVEKKSIFTTLLKTIVTIPEILEIFFLLGPNCCELLGINGSTAAEILT